MTLKLKLLCRVVRRRVERGEDLSEVLKIKEWTQSRSGTPLFGRCAAVFERKS